jgi:hypothetical protein
VLLLESCDSLKGELKSSLKNKDPIFWILGRERGSQYWILARVLIFLSGQQSKGVGGGLFIVPTKTEPLGKGFTRLVQWGTKQVQ